MIKKYGYDFSFNPLSCNSCDGNCCRGESGYIWVKYSEIERIAEMLEMDLEEFATIYLKKVGHRYSLVEKRLGENDFACVFFDEVRRVCTIYDVRPLQCRSYPFWNHYKNRENIKELRAECPGVL